MTSTDEPTPLIELPDITGELGINDKKLQITGKMIVTKDGTINLTIDPVPLTNETKWLLPLVPPKGRVATWAQLRATSRDAKTITSDYVYLGKRTTHVGGDNPGTISIEAEAHQVTLLNDEQPTTASNCKTTHHTVGMRGHSGQHATTPAGTIVLAGQTVIENHDEIAGFLSITAHDNETRPLKEWLDTCDETADHLLQIVSLAEAKRIQVSIRQTFKNQQLIRSDLYGARHTGTPFDGLFHFLNLQPVLDLAINNYTQALRETTGIELAINLLLANPGHVELLLVSGMTALEHLVSVYTSHHKPTPPIDTDAFKETIVPALKTAFDAITGTLAQPADEQEREDFKHRLARVRDRISNLNHTTFTDKLFRMLHGYHVPLAGIEDRITTIIKVRQDVIHTGRHQAEFKDFYLHVAILRELIKRIMLSLLEYEGEYISFLNGQETVHFPPINVTVAP